MPSLAARAATGASEIIDCETRPPKGRPLHIACALGGTDLGRSGIGTYARELLPELLEAVGADDGRLTLFGHERELTAFRRVAPKAGLIRVRWLPLKPAFSALWHLLRASAFAARVRADVLLLPAANRRITLTPGTVPTVAVVHDLAQLRVAGKYDPLRLMYFHRVLVPAFHRPTRIVAVSNATRDDLIGKLGVAPGRISVVYNGVNSRLFHDLDPESETVRIVRRELSLHDRPYLLYPARLEHPGKNHVRLLKAFARSGLAASHTLALSGADWGARGLIIRTARQLGIESSVRIVGFIATEQLPALVAGASAVLMLGLHEGFGLPALEGLSAGRPVCVSNTGALPEVVGPFGVQCDPFREDSIADSLRLVALDAEVRRLCQRDGPGWAGRFTWERTARGVLEACHDASTGTPAGASR